MNVKLMLPPQGISQYPGCGVCNRGKDDVIFFISGAVSLVLPYVKYLQVEEWRLSRKLKIAAHVVPCLSCILDNIVSNDSNSKFM